MQVWKYLSATALASLLSLSMFAADAPMLRMPSMPESKIVIKVRPAYPPDAADLRIHGVVKITVVIGTDGRVKDARLVSGHPLLVPAALQAVRKWVFQPTEIDGKPARVVTEIDIPFNMDAYGRPVESRPNPASQL